jgi:hypothetical protein
MISCRISVREYVAVGLMRLEMVFFDGCPSHERLLPRLRALAAEAGAELALRRVETPQEAERDRFLGSPTVRVDGRDVEPGAAARTDYGLNCRIYRSHELGQSTVPPERWIRVALGTDRG